MTPRLPLSILIPTRNERANIADCLTSAAAAAQVVVVDSGSTDGTVDIARAHGAEVVDFKWNGAFPRKKNWAIENIAWRHDWLFILDADERLTPALVCEIGRVLASPRHDGYYVNRRFWFLDGWLRHCGYFPSWNLRLFRHRLGRYERTAGASDPASGDNEVHEHVELRGSAGRLENPMDHYAFPSIDVWVEKHNRYSSWEARLLVEGGAGDTASIGRDLKRRRRLKALVSRLPFRPSLRFLYHYVLRAGFLDGYRGWVFCRLMGWYDFLSVAKARELRLTGKIP
jgi:glycosyltransferase involved in cell wall biosynthesis